MKGSMALSIPFGNYTGQLLFDLTAKRSKSNHYSVAYLVDYFRFLQDSIFENQREIWKETKKNTKKLLLKYKVKNVLFHSANSSTALIHGNNGDDFVRIGIAGYGYSELDTNLDLNLKPVLSLFICLLISTDSNPFICFCLSNCFFLH